MGSPLNTGRWIALAVIVALGVTGLAWWVVNARKPWWLEDTPEAAALRHIADAADWTVSAPAWNTGFRPTRVALEDGLTIQFLSSGAGPGNTKSLDYRQTADAQFTPEHWEGGLLTETVMIGGVPATLEYGYTTTGPGVTTLIRPGEPPTPLAAIQAARVWWHADGYTYLVEGRFVSEKAVLKMAESVQPVILP